MGFDSERFKRAEYTPRVEKVTIPELAEFFGAGEAPEFVVRGLTASELHIALEASIRTKSVDAVVKAIATQQDQVEAIRRALGTSSETPGEISKRQSMLVFGTVSPVIDEGVAVALAKNFPAEFFLLTNHIRDLTGQGASRVKPRPSTHPTAT